MPKRINRAVELLEQDQPVYYTGFSAVSYEAGLEMAGTHADYINVSMEHGTFDLSGLDSFMKGLLRIAVPILLTPPFSEAQFPDRLFPFAELTDGMRARVDLKDGSVEDWSEVLGEPTLTALDFATMQSFFGVRPIVV